MKNNKKHRDWSGNQMSLFVCNGDSNHSNKDRAELDYYATPPIMANELLLLEPDLSHVWECACGEGHLAKVFKEMGLLDKASDIVDRGYGEVIDFLNYNQKYNGDIVTNPPYNKAQEFVEHALDITYRGNKICMFLKLTFLEGKKRQKLFARKNLKTVYVSRSRVSCVANGNFDVKQSNAVAFAWFIFENGYNGYPTIKWFN